MRSTSSHRDSTTFREQACRYRRLDPRAVILVVLSTALVFGPGCTTTRTIVPQSQSAGNSGLKAGDTVKATLRDGRELELIFVEETTDHIVGRDAMNSVRTIPRKQILYLQSTTVSAAKTVLLVGGIALVIGLAQYAAAHAALLSGGW